MIGKAVTIEEWQLPLSNVKSPCQIGPVREQRHTPVEDLDTQVSRTSEERTM